MKILKEQLQQIKVLSFHFFAEEKLAKGSMSARNLSGQGVAKVRIKKCQNNLHKSKENIIFYESGTWRNEAGMEFSFNNTYQWVFSEKDFSKISIEHLRLGEDKPVFLCHLEPVIIPLSAQHNTQLSTQQWQSNTPHICGLDSYEAMVQMKQHSIILQWLISGPKKQQRIQYTYTT